MKDQSALRPEALNFTSYIQRKDPVEEPTVEEGVLAAGADKVFWKTLKQHFDSHIRDLEMINEAAIASGMTFEEIGRNALVLSQVKGIIRKVINSVEDAREARDDRQK